MKMRFKRVVVFIGALTVLMVGFLPSIIVWIIVGRMYPMEWLEWAVTTEHPQGK